MPDQEVLINDSNLNAIANAIRRKNGLVRTYKPREMAPAIRAINADAPDSREYTVTVIQTPHQTIKVRQVLGGEKQYDQSFTVSEPYWKIQATIEADAGYIAGGLNYPEEVTVDRDITIKATPATEVVVPPDQIVTLYWRDTYNGAGIPGRYSSLYYLNDDDTYTAYNNGTEVTQSKPQGKHLYNIICNTEQVPWQMINIFAVHPHRYQYIVDATDIIIDLGNKKGLVQIGLNASNGRIFYNNIWVESISLVGWDTSELEYIYNFINQGNMSRLKSIGDISHWDTGNLKVVYGLLKSSDYLESLDLSGWNTPNLTSATNIFSGGRILDISNWDTTNISSFSAGISAKTKVGVLYPAYLIMDKEEVKFSGNYIFSNIANCKYLVPESMVDAYKQHPNWASRASQIESITNYTINRGDGQIEVVPNW